MHRVCIGEIHRKRDFEAAELKIASARRDCVDLKRNPIAIWFSNPVLQTFPSNGWCE